MAKADVTTGSGTGVGAAKAEAAHEQVEDSKNNSLQQYEIVWICSAQYALSGQPDGFGLEIVDFLGPGDPDSRGQRTVWVRGPVIGSAASSGGTRLVRGELVTVAIPDDQPRAARTGGRILPPPFLERSPRHAPDTASPPAVR
jgi:hypothetical protein